MFYHVKQNPRTNVCMSMDFGNLKKNVFGTQKLGWAKLEMYKPIVSTA